MLGEGDEFANSLFFEDVKTKLSKENIAALQTLKQASETRANYLKQEIHKLET